MNLWLIVPMLMLPVVALLLYWALRGRRIDDHPLCRQCGFDLFGKPHGSTRCSECGADLNRRRALRIGHRKSHRRLAGALFAMLLLCAGWSGLVGYTQAKGVDWNRRAPLWWIMQRAGSDNAAARDAAVTELLRRIEANTLTDAQLAQSVEKALAYQGDTEKPWNDAWGRIILYARSTGRLTDPQWVQYLKQALVVSLETPARVRTGERLTYKYRRKEIRAVADERVIAYVQPSSPWYDFSPGDTWRSPDGWPVWFKNGGWANSVDEASMQIEQGPGRRTLRLPVQLKVYQLNESAQYLLTRGRNSSIYPSPQWRVPPEGGLRVNEQVDATAPIEVLTGDWDPRIDDPALRQPVEEAVHVKWLAWEGMSIRVVLEIDNVPIALASRVYLRTASSETPIGAIVCPAGGSVKFEGQCDGHGVLREQVDVILRPDVRVAIPDPRIDRYWGRAIELKEIPVRAPWQSWGAR